LSKVNIIVIFIVVADVVAVAVAAQNVPWRGALDRIDRYVDRYFVLFYSNLHHTS
jgi:hypothetical protein